MTNHTPSTLRDRVQLLLVWSSPLFLDVIVIYGGLLWEKLDPEPRRKEQLRLRIADEYRQRGDTIVALEFRCSQCGELQSPIGTDGNRCPFCYAVLEGQTWGP